jgi:ubiquinone/menaquinone biosynthesis C-methylase UbiE
MILDVGCGQRQLGDVNVDIQKPATVKPNCEFILVDLNYGLPFNNDCFETVYCHHVIEHVKNPYFLLDELIRVTNWHVEVRCPWRFSGYAKGKKKRGHIHTFNKTWFMKLLNQRRDVSFFDVFVTLDVQREIFVKPLEIVVRIWKKKT